MKVCILLFMAAWVHPPVLLPAANVQEIPQDVQTSLERAFLGNRLSSELNLRIIEFSQEDLPSGALLLEVDAEISYRGERREIQLLGYGKDWLEALQDMEAYFVRVLPYESIKFSRWVQPRIEHISAGSVFIYSQEPITQRGIEFQAVDQHGNIQGMLSLRPVSYWNRRSDQKEELPGRTDRGTAADTDLWQHYLPADVIYASGPLIPGMEVQPFSRLGISLTLRGGAAVLPKGKSAWSIGALAAFDAMFDFMYPLLRIDQVIGSGEDAMTKIQAGWGFSLSVPGKASRAGGLLSRSEIHVTCSGGIGFNEATAEKYLFVGNASGAVRIYLTPRWSTDAFGELQVSFPEAGSGQGTVHTLSTGVGVTLRL